MKTLAAVLIGSATLAAPALAGGLATPAPEPEIMQAAPPAPTFAGGEWGGAYVGGSLGYGDVSGDVDGNGTLGGVQAGYRWDLGRTVLGAEVATGAADVSLGSGKIDSLTQLKLQAGYDLGRTLVYATAGGASASGDIGGSSVSDTGYFGGLGVDYALTDRWSLGAEVLAHKFDNFDGTGVDADATTAAIRANFRF